PSSDTEVAGIRRGISSCAGGASYRQRRLRFGSFLERFDGQHLAEGGLLFRQFPTIIGEECFTDYAAVVSKPQPPQHELRETVPCVEVTYPYRASRHSSNSRDWLRPEKPDIIILPSEHHPNSALLEAGSQNLERNPRRFHGGLRSNGARNRMLGYPSHKVRSVPDFVGTSEEVGCGPPPNRCVQVAEQPGEVAQIGRCAWPLSSGPRPGRIIDELSRDRLQAHLLEGVRFVRTGPTEQRGQLRILQGTFPAGPDERGQSKPALQCANPVGVG